MKIAMGTYVDNQDVVAYPVPFLTEYWGSFDYLFWFGSDENNCNILRELAAKHRFKDKISIVNLYQKIVHPYDIGMAQNKAVAYMLANTDGDYIGYEQADLCLTDVGVDAIHKCIDQNMPAFSIAAMQSKLYCELWHNPNGCTFMNRTVQYNSPRDGMEVKFTVNGHTADPLSQVEEDSNKRFMLDLGYFSTDAYYRK